MDLRSKDAIESSKQHDIDMNNTLIAEFMGVKTITEAELYSILRQNRENGFIHTPQAYTIDELKYHSSWDSLMPVVEKINLLDDYRYTVYIASMDTKIVDNISGNVIVEIDCKHSIDELRQSVYEAVVEFIKEHKIAEYNERQ